MPEIIVPAPGNKAVRVYRAVMNALIEGFGAEVAIKLGQAEAPFLAMPIVAMFYEPFVRFVASEFSLGLERLGAKVIINFQSEERLKEFDDAKKRISNGVHMSPQELKRQSDAARAIIYKRRD
mgnify:CR=1 FL=1